MYCGEEANSEAFEGFLLGLRLCTTTIHGGGGGGGVRDKHDDECHPRLPKKIKRRHFWSAFLQKAEVIEAEIGPKKK